ncbi:hypothetical protein EV426DRAFT_709060 [Tirmania nivea]|nr:hypothetical protein EV426DRAFT_709060 [Tirmania nivea]
MFSPEELRKKEREDLEAQHSTKLANGVAEEQTAAQGSEDSTEYKHMGRGGAGNWYTPNKLSKEGVFTDITPSHGASTTPDPTSVNPAHANHQIDPRPWRGRGGAGNFTLDKPVELEALEMEERHAAQAVQEEVRRVVEAGLKKPESVYLATTLKKDKS